ncbi:GbsR/MarR family transcriptional regulator [Endothiovibrio diazotrophicus]
MQLTPVTEKFVLHWGEMGSRWGVNRTVAQIHALLYLSPEPLNAEEITHTLGVARSNVSNSLKELQGWGLVKTVHVLGDRRDHFESLKDPWDLFLTIVEERKRREIDPTLTVLRQCVMEGGGKRGAEREVQERIEAVLGFVEGLTGWYEQMKRLPRPVLMKLMKMGGKVAKLMER